MYKQMIPINFLNSKNHYQTQAHGNINATCWQSNNEFGETETLNFPEDKLISIRRAEGGEVISTSMDAISLKINGNGKLRSIFIADGVSATLLGKLAAHNAVNWLAEQKINSNIESSELKDEFNSHLEKLHAGLKLQFNQAETIREIEENERNPILKDLWIEKIKKNETASTTVAGMIISQAMVDVFFHGDGVAILTNEKTAWVVDKNCGNRPPQLHINHDFKPNNTICKRFFFNPTGNLIFLSTDGISKRIKSQDIAETLKNGIKESLSLEQIIQPFLKQTYPDDLSFVIARI